MGSDHLRSDRCSGSQSALRGVASTDDQLIPERPLYRRIIAQDFESEMCSSNGAEAFFSAAWTLAEGWENRVTLGSC